MGKEPAIISRTATGEQQQVVRVRSSWRRMYRVYRRDIVVMSATIVLGIILLALIAAPLLAPYDPLKTELSARLLGPGSNGHLLGTDQLGRDLFARVLYGGRNTLLITWLPALISIVGGTTLGLIAGYFAGWVDNLLMRLADVFLAFPALILAIAISASLGGSLYAAIVAISMVRIWSFARIIRSQSLVIREQDYVQAARALGASTPRLIRAHLFPNVLPLVIVYTSLSLASMLLLAAGLSFLGVGIQPPAPEWGGMVSEGRSLLLTAPHLTTVPGLAIFVVALAFNIIGDGLRDAVDPRLQA